MKWLRHVFIFAFTICAFMSIARKVSWMIAWQRLRSLRLWRAPDQAVPARAEVEERVRTVLPGRPHGRLVSGAEPDGVVLLSGEARE